MKSATKPSWVLGIDGGGTHTRGYLALLTGEVTRTAEAGPLNWNTSGWPQARQTLQIIIRQLRMTDSIRKSLIQTVIGCAALNDRATPRELKKLVQGILPLKTTTLVSDGETAWFGAGLGQPGLLVISGTGSVVFAGRRHSKLLHVGGWGPALGDEGSARWLALHLLRRCLGADEGTCPPVSPQLSALVRRHFKVQNWNQFLEQFYQDPLPAENLGNLSATVDRELPRDTVWLEITRQAGKELAWQTFVAAQKARLLPSLKPVPCWTQGSVLTENQSVQRSFRNALRPLRIHVTPPTLHPSLGTVALALSQSGVRLPRNPKVVSKLQDTAP